MKTECDILVVVSCSGGDIPPETDELIAFSRRLQVLQGGCVRVLAVGEGIDGAGWQIARQSGLDVTVLRTPGVSNYVGEAYRALLADEIRITGPVYVCTAHTSQGGEWAPAVAARIGAACISGVSGVLADGGRICFEKELYGGKVVGRFAPRTAPCILTLQPGRFKTDLPEARTPGNVNYKTAGYRLEKSHYRGKESGGAGDVNLADARVVVAVGNGIGSEDNLGLIYRLARMLPKAVVAGTRIVCDRGWLGYHRQVGVTGATVSPEVYIACGISGASQHVTGMRGSKFVIAVNTDAGAPIFNEADIGIVADITQFVPLVEESW